MALNRRHAGVGRPAVPTYPASVDASTTTKQNGKGSRRPSNVTAAKALIDHLAKKGLTQVRVVIDGGKITVTAGESKDSPPPGEWDNL